MPKKQRTNMRHGRPGPKSPEFIGGVRVPTTATLRKYGLDVVSWRAILHRQDGSCAACGTVPPSGILHVDHEHVRGWAKMAPAERRKYVRGLLCYRDNHFFCARGMTQERALSIALYLEAHTKRVSDSHVGHSDDGGR